MRKSHYNIKSMCMKKLQPDLKCITFLDAPKFKRLWINFSLILHFPLNTHSIFWSEVSRFFLMLLFLYYYFVINLKNLFMLPRTKKNSKKTTCRRVQAWESVVCNSVCSFFIYIFQFCNPENTHWNRERIKRKINKKRQLKALRAQST